MEKRTITRFQANLLRWYRKHARRLPWRETTDPYAIWISEVMLQQTQVKTVLLYFENFMRRFPDVETLARADLSDVLKQWEGLGYYARARNLHRAANILVTEHQGLLPSDRRRFQQLPGVGDYIAAAVLSIAFNRAHPVVDGNVKRVLARLFEMDVPANQSSAYRQFHAAAAELLSARQPGDFNQAMMELGALICSPNNPDCAACPVKFACRALAHQTVAVYPRKRKAKPVPKTSMVIGIVFKDDRVLITKRPPHGLLGGLWEFPGGEVKRNEKPAAACKRVLKQVLDLTVAVEAFVTQVTHAYTHFKIKADVFICTYRRGAITLRQAVEYRWIRLDELDRYAFPKVNHKFFKALLAKVADRKGRAALK